MKIKIRSIEKYLPGEPISSSKLDTIAGIPTGRIEKNTGVSYRYNAGPEESVCDMGATALRKALKAAAMKPEQLDLLLFTGASFDFPVPHNAGIVKSKIAGDECQFACMDIDSTCLSFLNGLDIANLYINSGRYKRVAVVCAEMASRTITPKEEKTFGLFGDAAVAIILEASENEGYEQSYSDFVNYPSGALLARLPIGGAVNRGRGADSDNPGYYFQMDGKSLIRLTTKYLDPFVGKLESNTGIEIGKFKTIVAHQTSRYGNEYFHNRFNLSKEQVINTLTDHGNCISASIPLGLEKVYNERQGKFTKENILLIGTAAGLSLGCMILKFD